VNVVGHYAPSAKLVALAREMAEGVRDNFGDAGIAEMALAKADIESLFSSF